MSYVGFFFGERYVWVVRVGCTCKVHTYTSYVCGDVLYYKPRDANAVRVWRRLFLWTIQT